MKFIIIYLGIFICYSNLIYSQVYYYTATDDDSVTYTVASGKLLVLKRDAQNYLELVQSKTIDDVSYSSAAVSNDKLLLTSEDSAYVFDISDRLNPVYITKKYFGNIARVEKFGEHFIIIKKDMAGHSVVGIIADTLKVYSVLDRECHCYITGGNMCNNLTFSYPYAFYRFTNHLLETWEFEEQTGLFYLLNLTDYTTYDWQLTELSSSANFVFLLLIRDLGNSYYIKNIYKMRIESDTLLQEGIIYQDTHIPSIGGDWDISESFHRIYNDIFKFDTPTYDPTDKYIANIPLLLTPYPIITDKYVYQCGNNFYYSYRTTDDSLIGKKFTAPLNINSENQSLLNFSLTQNYPNPFNPVTSIQYAVGNRQFVTLKVYDVLGNEVATLVNEEKPAGSYTVKLNGINLSSGIYFYQMHAGNYSATKKLILIK